MKLLTLLLAMLACSSVSVRALPPDKMDTAAENRAFAEEFLRDARRLKSNAAGSEGVLKVVYDLYRDIFDEDELARRGILKTRRPGRYITPQTTLDYGVLPADSTLGSVRELLEIPADSQLNANVLPERLQVVLDNLIPFRYEAQKAFRETVSRRILTFYPQTFYLSDSVVYITKELMKRLEEFSMEGVKIGPAVARERNDFLTAEFSARASAWQPYVHWIDRPLTIISLVLEQGMQRAFVNALVGGTQGWGLLVECDAWGEWQIVAARVLYQAS